MACAMKARTAARPAAAARGAARAARVQRRVAVRAGDDALAFPDSDPLMLRTIRGEEHDRPPVWMMRQAGRYMKVYQGERARGAAAGARRMARPGRERARRKAQTAAPGAEEADRDCLHATESPLSRRACDAAGARCRAPAATHATAWR